jgi:SAM-dependent methyltransferase
LDATNASDGVDDWESHWSAYAAAAERNPAQEFRRRLIVKHLGQLDASSRLVDIGCGQGDLLRFIHSRFPLAALAGIDQSSSGLAEATTKVPSARFVQADLAAAPIPAELSGWATHATCSEVLEHVDDPAAFLQRTCDILGSSCHVVITVPGGPMSAYDRSIGHRRHYDARALRDVVRDAGFEVVRLRRCGFPVFNVYKLLVVARGDRLIDEANASAQGGQSKLTSLATNVFRPAFHLTVPDFPLGWQLLAVVRPR